MTALGRFLIGLCLLPCLVLGGLALPFILACNRGSYAERTGSAASCMLNAMTGGPREVTFSAWRWQLLLHGKRGAAWWVDAVDGFGLRSGHCQAAWASHIARGLLPLRREV
ncbi:hypothetical protein [Muricoccus vinaceus]|uniref:Uncharacterized protein n=1 Tax=Muricoccus vinaceus TaxID=424704 RepID=A0ABV6IM42_9PROT